MKNFRTHYLAPVLCGVVLFGVAHKAGAQLNLIQNGLFKSSTPISGATYAETSAGGQLGYNLNVTGWSTTGGLNLLVNSGAAALNGVNDQYGTKNWSLWSPTASGVTGNGGAGTIPVTSPPGGGSFLAADDQSGYNQAITQTISGMTVGQTYVVSFEWAGGQQYNNNGADSAAWQVSLGSQTQTTATYNNPGAEFSGWMNQSFSFTATSNSEVLSFFADGTPSGPPPFSLLADVTMVAAPEPSTILAGAFLLLPVCVRLVRVLRRKVQA